MLNRAMRPIAYSAKQRGAALVVGLVLLVVVTVLAISGMNTATTELAIARNDQNYENAFQAAETGLEWALSQGFFKAVRDTETKLEQKSTANDYLVNTVIEFKNSTGVPDTAFSLGVGSGMSAYHFVATATTGVVDGASAGQYDPNASAVHTQAFYIVGPGASGLPATAPTSSEE